MLYCHFEIKSKFDNVRITITCTVFHFENHLFHIHIRMKRITNMNSTMVSWHNDKTGLVVSIVEEKLQKRFNTSSRYLGFVLGSFFQFSTLVFNRLMISFLGYQSSIILASLMAFISVSITMLVLKLARDAVTTAFRHKWDPSDDNDTYFIDRLHEILFAMETNVILGILLGVSLSWVATEILFGMHVEMAFTLGLLIFSLAFVWILLRVCVIKYEDISGTDDSDKNETLADEMEEDTAENV